MEKLLRKRQEEGKIVVMTQKKVEHIYDHDKVIILHLAATKEYAPFKDLIKNPRSYIDNFIKKK